MATPSIETGLKEMGKHVLNAAQDAPVHAGIEMEGLAYGRLRTSNDFAEGVASFHEKRKPVWTGS